MQHQQPERSALAWLSVLRTGIASERATIFSEELAEVRDAGGEDTLELPDESGDDPEPWGPSA